MSNLLARVLRASRIVVVSADDALAATATRTASPGRTNRLTSARRLRRQGSWPLIVLSAMDAQASTQVLTDGAWSGEIRSRAARRDRGRSSPASGRARGA